VGVGADAACAATVSKAKTVPVILVFMFDRSGSMDDSIGPGQTKWSALVPGLDAFFADPKSAGVSASLQFFEQASECDVPSYAAPLVPTTPLPNSTVFASAIAAVSPQGETPTQPALEGALQYAAQQLALNPNGKSAVVLVTDGEPNGCASTVTNVAATAQAVSATIPTYVIGIGKATDLVRLNTIAAAGATGTAFFVSSDAGDGGCDAGGCSAQDMESRFESVLAVIRGATASCNLLLPSPPPGQSLNLSEINVSFAPSSGQTTTLVYNQNCGGGGVGWFYDNLQSPTKIEICPSSCQMVQSDVLGGSLSIAVGCQTVTQ